MDTQTIAKKFVQNIIQKALKLHRRVRWADKIIHKEVTYYIGKHNKLKPVKPKFKSSSSNKLARTNRKFEKK